MIFGRRGCSEKRDWQVLVFLKGNDCPIEVGEQLTKKEAEKIYDNIKSDFLNKNSYIEIEVNGVARFIPKDSILHIKLEDC